MKGRDDDDVVVVGPDSRAPWKPNAIVVQRIAREHHQRDPA